LRLTPLQPWIAAKIGAPLKFSCQALEDYQLSKLNETLALIRGKSPFYRSKLADVPPGLTSLQDLENFPFTSADDIRREPLRFLCVPQGEIERVVTLDTSGSSGSPKRLYFTLADQELTVDFFHIGMSTLVGKGDRVLILLPGQTPGSVGDLLFKGLLRLGAVPFKHGPVSDPLRALEIMHHEKIDALVGVPFQVLTLASCDPYGLRLKNVLLSTDYVPDAIIHALQKAWGCRVFNHYGMTEMGLGGGVSCEAQHGYHLREADLYFEIIDPISEAPLADGEEGEVVFTTLTRAGMPLWRYRTGDISRFIPGPCPCGSLLKRIAWVWGRLSGQLKLGDGVLSINTLDEALFAVDGLINYSAVLSSHDDHDILVLEVTSVAGKSLAAACKAALEVLFAEDPRLCATKPLFTIQEKVFKPGSSASMAKRMIEDQRGL
jgi:phenylacetate-CoA ligase